MKPHLCSKCGERNPDNFYPSQRSICKKCSIARSVANRQRTSPNKIPHVCKECGCNDPTQFYISNKYTCKACCISKSTTRYHSLSNEDKQRQQHQMAAWQDDNMLRYRWQTAKHRSMRKKREFTITERDVELLWETQKGLCYYTKRPMKLTRDDSRHSVSLDRLDSTVGYIPGNVVLCCAAVNLMKNDLEMREFKDLITLLSEQLDNF